MLQTHTDVDLLSSRLHRAQADYEFARSRGDDERIRRSRLQISAIRAELDRLVPRTAAASVPNYPLR